MDWAILHVYVAAYTHVQKRLNTAFLLTLHAWELFNGLPHGSGAPWIHFDRQIIVLTNNHILSTTSSDILLTCMNCFGRVRVCYVRLVYATQKDVLLRVAMC